MLALVFCFCQRQGPIEKDFGVTIFLTRRVMSSTSYASTVTTLHDLCDLKKKVNQNSKQKVTIFPDLKVSIKAVV